MPNNGLDTLLEALRAIMKDAGAKSRLRDIIPVEISLVDRAANKRRFLTIKNNAGVETMTTLLKVDLPANLREGVEKALATALQQLHEITKAVTEGEAVSTDAAMPEDFTKAISGILDQLGGVVDINKEMPSVLGTEASDKLKAIAAAIATIAEAESPDSVTDMIGRLVKLSGADSKEAATLKALGDLSIALINDQVQDGKHADNTVAKVKEVSIALSALMGDAEPATPAEPAPVVEPVVEPTVEPTVEQTAKVTEPVEPTEPASVVTPEPATKATEPTTPAEPAPVVEPTVKVTEPVEPAEPATPAEPAAEDSVEKAMTNMVAEVVKAGAKMSKERKALLRAALKAISDLADQVDPADPVDKVSEPAPVVPPEPAPVTKSDDSVNVLKMVRELSEKVSTLMDKPAVPASRRVEGNPETGTASPVPESPTPRRKRRWIA
jgi:hypothetical protein